MHRVGLRAGTHGALVAFGRFLPSSVRQFTTRSGPSPSSSSTGPTTFSNRIVRPTIASMANNAFCSAVAANTHSYEELLTPLLLVIARPGPRRGQKIHGDIRRIDCLEQDTGSARQLSKKEVIVREHLCELRRRWLNRWGQQVKRHRTLRILLCKRTQFPDCPIASKIIVTASERAAQSGCDVR